MKRKLIAILAAIVVFFIGVLIIAYFKVKGPLSLALLASCTFATYKLIVNPDTEADDDNNQEDSY